MSIQQNHSIKIAILDMNNGVANQAMKGIQKILNQYSSDKKLMLEVGIYDIRQKGEVPDLSYHIYIASGGPGSPYDGEGEKWEDDFFELLDQIDQFNLENEEKKYAFLICHSFQLACRKYQLGKVTRRQSNAFGIFPITITPQGKKESVFQGLNNPFFSFENRDWQVVQPQKAVFEKMGAELLALEKERRNPDMERCMMAIRFSPYVVGTQFHPEVNPQDMKSYLQQPDKKTSIIKNHGEEKYYDMLDSLENPDRIMLTQRIILPNFLDEAIDANVA